MSGYKRQLKGKLGKGFLLFSKYLQARGAKAKPSSVYDPSSLRLALHLMNIGYFNFEY